MARRPNRYIMSCSYNSQLTMDFGRQVRQVVEDKAVPQAFPNFILSTESRAADVWRTEEGGAYFAVGVGGTTSGRPANLLLVDDPIKSREDAESMTQRNKTWNYYTSALATRLQPEGDSSPPQTNHHPHPLASRRPRGSPSIHRRLAREPLDTRQLLSNQSQQVQEQDKPSLARTNRSHVSRGRRVPGNQPVQALRRI